ncbi:multicopper oxidase domain-containing protein [Candidatus Flexifilum breve]|uniref:multicopper oxidase family protein n=1 Tax=Candidatus Flexifilum breve TaxID=3140694 RepID=UPI0031CCA8C4
MQRRDFLKMMGVGAGAVGAGALGIKTTPKQPARQVTPEDAAAMDQHHREAVELFLANIGADPNFWGLPLEFTMDGDVKVFTVNVQEVEWFTTPTMSFPAMSYNGVVPGPYIRATEGETIRLIVNNEMSESTNIHFHGLRVPNNQDGVPYVTEEPILPGASRTYEFPLRNYGTHMYHSHHNAAEQVTRGLMAAFIVDPADASAEPEVSAEYIWVLNDSAMGFTINGKSFPYTQPIVAKLGDKIRVRYMNEGLMIHPMHLHGIPQMVYAKDGFPLPQPYMCDTLNVAPGERYDVIIDCNDPGLWAYHCHVLTHAESRDGMFGMVTVLVVNAE